LSDSVKVKVKVKGESGRPAGLQLIYYIFRPFSSVIHHPLLYNFIICFFNTLNRKSFIEPFAFCFTPDRSLQYKQSAVQSAVQSAKSGAQSSIINHQYAFYHTLRGDDGAHVVMAGREDYGDCLQQYHLQQYQYRQRKHWQHQHQQQQQQQQHQRQLYPWPCQTPTEQSPPSPLTQFNITNSSSSQGHYINQPQAW